MPTNVSTPIWRCDICGERFGPDQATAERCESAGQPSIMPAGTLMLGYGSLHGSYDDRFVLRQLYPFKNGHRMGTLAARHHQRAGHTVTYAIDLDPALYWNADRDYYEWPNGLQPKQIDSEHLTPNRAGVLQLHTNAWLGHHASIRDHADCDWLFAAVGLTRGTLNPDRDRYSRWARPLTPAVLAVLDAINAYPKFISDKPAIRHYGNSLQLNDTLSNYALGKTRVEGRQANTRRTLWYLRGANEDQLVAEVNDLWRRWRGGSTCWDRGGFGGSEPMPVEDIDVPRPYMVSTKDHLTASKLPKRLKELVAATGVEWPARTDASAYARILIDKTLEYRMETEARLFPGARVIAVRGRKGGVGKSTVAAALARRLAVAGRSVVLVDFDVAGPSQHIIHNLGEIRADTERVMVLPSETDVPGLRVFSPGQVFGADAKTQWSETTVGQWVDFVGSSLDLGGAEFVVIDMPPGESGLHHVIGDVADRGAVDVEVHVTTGHPLSLGDTERDLVKFRPVAGTRFLVENLSRVRGFVGMGNSVEVRLHGITEDAPAMAERTGTEWAGSLPWAASVAALADSPEITKLADQVCGGTRAPSEGPAESMESIMAASLDRDQADSERRPRRSRRQPSAEGDTRA